MGRLISSLNITPDGFCNHFDVIADDEHHAFATGLLKNSDKVLLGRVTYELFENYWTVAAKDTSLPKSASEFARLINNIDKVVPSRYLKNLVWQNTTVLRDFNIETVENLKNSTNKDIVVFGSPSLVSELAKMNLIDVYYFSVQPIISGKGKRLFETLNLDNPIKMELTEKFFFKSGVTTLCYQADFK